MTLTLPRYQPQHTYDWNYEHAPEPVECDVPALPGTWQFCGLPVDSPLGVPAGPLLNSRWVLYYASLGFDVLTYKTVRSTARACYPLPNLQPVACGALYGGEASVAACPEMHGSWAVSFGMPSKSPAVWRADVERARALLPRRKVLCVSVVGTEQPGWQITDLANDYARCARWAIEAGAEAVELNFSCPNVATCDGQLYQDSASARLVAECVRVAIGRAPLLIKIGHVPRDDAAAELLEALHGVCDGLAMTNSVATTVVDGSGRLLFDGQRRGICGEATRAASTAQVARFARVVSARGFTRPRLIAVGGAATADHVCSYLAAGAESVHLATAAMVQPDVAVAIRRDWAAACRP